jgi:hypothetical protein
MSLHRRILSLGLLSLAACTADVTTPPNELPGDGPSKEVQHEWTNGAYGLLFLPNTVPAGYPAFDNNVTPTLRLCLITNTTTNTCGSTIATWTRGSVGSYSRSMTVSSTAYSLLWPIGTGGTAASAGQTYRLTVTAGGRTLGWQDVRVVSTLAQFNAVNTAAYKPCYLNQNCNVSFRIAVGTPGSISVSTSSVSLNVGDGVVVTGQVRDLRGNVMANTPVSFELESVSQPAAAQLDSGMVVADRPGTSILWAGYLDLWEDIPVTVTDTRRAWVKLTSKDDQGNRGIWGSAANNVYTANYMGLWKYNGTTWGTVPEARWRTFYDVYGTSASNVFAVGADGLIMRYNGTTWSAQRYNGTIVANEPLYAPVIPARKYTLRALWGLPVQNFTVTVGDSGTVLYHDGTSWTDFSVPTDAALTDVWGTDYNNFYATTSDGRLMRWNGFALSYVAGVNAPGALHAVWGTSATNMYVAGDGGTLYRYNGSTWTRIWLPTRSTLYAIWGTSSTNMFVGGEDGALYRYDGTSWIPEKSNGGASQIYGFWGTASGTDLFASGAGGLVIKR